MKKLTGIIVGAVLITCGVLYFLNAFGLTDFDLSLNGWWTLFIIVPCLEGIIAGKDKIGSAIGLCVGILLLLAASDVLGYDVIWKITTPIIVIAIGIKIILKSLRVQKNDDAPHAEKSEAEK